MFLKGTVDWQITLQVLKLIMNMRDAVWFLRVKIDIVHKTF